MLSVNSGFVGTCHPAGELIGPFKLVVAFDLSPAGKREAFGPFNSHQSRSQRRGSRDRRRSNVKVLGRGNKTACLGSRRRKQGEDPPARLPPIGI
jgi:hypothetical protein